MLAAIITGVVCLILGLIGGFYGGVEVLKRRLEKEQMSEKQIQIMAKQMGMNLNQKQLAQVTRQMKSAKEKEKAKKKTK
ncbi:MAG: hypothetical protein JWN30_123 [Bacilli bacterium]|nr:hypothetical protein [Bacilli bacterium]